MTAKAATFELDLRTHYSAELRITNYDRAVNRNESNGDSHMKITRSSVDTRKGPAEWFTGDVFIDVVAELEASSRVSGSNVHFAPGARTAWHTHPHGQTIFVLEGIGRCQRKGGPVEEIRPRRPGLFEPGENHWHGAAPNWFMLHLAVAQADDDGNIVSWGDHVTGAEYDAGK